MRLVSIIYRYFHNNYNMDTASQAPQNPTPPQTPGLRAPGVPQARPAVEKERVLRRMPESRRANLVRYLLSIVLVCVGVYVYLYNPFDIGIVPTEYLGIGLSVLGVIIILYSELKLIHSYYYMTQNRIVEVSGILRKRERALQIPQIESVTIHQSFLNRILKIGSIEVKTAGESMVLHKIISEVNRIRGHSL
jgi:membrane protein YdbS with pleckstrin-like domain